MNIFVSDSYSTLGSAIIKSFFESGNNIFCFSPSRPYPIDIKSFLKNIIGQQAFDVVLLTAGAEKFYTSLRNADLRKQCSENLNLSHAICSFFADQPTKPEVILSASSLTYYEHGDTPCTEESAKGNGFIPDYFMSLEEAVSSASGPIRCVHLRLGVVLSRSSAPVTLQSTLLANRFPAFTGDRQRFISWVSEEDALRALRFLFDNKKMHGPVNIACGDNISRMEFINEVIKKFGLKKTIPLPKKLFGLLFGGEVESLQSGSSRAIPLRLMESGFLFQDISLSEYYESDKMTVSR